MSTEREYEVGADGMNGAGGAPGSRPNVYHPQPAPAPAYEQYADPAAAHGWQNDYDATRELPALHEAHEAHETAGAYEAPEDSAAPEVPEPAEPALADTSSVPAMAAGVPGAHPEARPVHGQHRSRQRVG
ncbi:hypothetical protein ABZV75_26280, partial [Streptomyces flaveolus]